MTEAQSSLPSPRTLDDIWAGDLFDRRSEAALLEAYIESVAGRPSRREDASGFTISVDCGYGEGKTFFLKRLGEQLALNHPVAFVDAWADDLADQPIVALAATFKRALQPIADQGPALRKAVKAVFDKTGKILQIAAIGATKRALALALTAEGVSLAEGVLKDASDAVKEKTDDTAKDIAKDLTGDALQALRKRVGEDSLRTRIAEFEKGKAAIEALKQSLRDLVGALPKEKYAPVVIIVDELDRCRPTYAIKFMEEVKHLFDVAGIVFVFGMHGTQLSKSIVGCYGPNFDGEAYLGRFIGRKYNLRVPSQVGLYKALLVHSGIDLTRFRFPQVFGSDGNAAPSDLYILISSYAEMTALTARDAFSVIDCIQTCAALTGEMELWMPYLLPLLISKIKFGSPEYVKNVPLNSLTIRYRFSTNAFSTGLVNARDYFDKFEAIAICSRQELWGMLNTENDIRRSQATVVHDMRESATALDQELGLPENYRLLVEAVGRFSSNSGG